MIAGTLLAVLLILGGLDFLEDTGLIHYSTSELDKTVEDALDNYGEAIRSAAIDGDSSHHLNPQSFAAAWISYQDFVADQSGHTLRRKGSLDFAATAFDPLVYSPVLLV